MGPRTITSNTLYKLSKSPKNLNHKHNIYFRFSMTLLCYVDKKKFKKCAYLTLLLPIVTLTQFQRFQNSNINKLTQKVITLLWLSTKYNQTYNYNNIAPLTNLCNSKTICFMTYCFVNFLLYFISRTYPELFPFLNEYIV